MARQTEFTIASFQKKIEEIYFEKDSRRGVPGTFLWFSEEIGELARCLNSGGAKSAAEEAEFADVLAWLCSLASLRGIDLEKAACEKYSSGCPRCQNVPCSCSHRNPEGGGDLVEPTAPA